MTANKRFTYDYEDDKYYDKGFFKDNGKELYKEELLELLNALHEENEKLKEQLKIYKTDGLETLKDLERAYENNKKALNNIEQLYKENKELKDLLKSMADRNNEIWLDNGQIIRLKKVFKGEWIND